MSYVLAPHSNVAFGIWVNVRFQLAMHAAALFNVLSGARRLS